MELRIKLPIPAPELAANARCHWSKKAQIAKAYRQRAAIEAAHQLQGQRHIMQGYRLEFTWADKRRRDKRNAAERCKAYEDGISDFLQQDDSEWDFDGVRFMPPNKQDTNCTFIFTTKPRNNNE